MKSGGEVFRRLMDKSPERNRTNAKHSLMDIVYGGLSRD